MSKDAAKPKEPLPPAARQRALWQGALALPGAVAGFLGAAWLLNAMGSTSRWPVLFVFFLCFAAVIYAVWKLGVARDGRWDGRGLIALGLLILGYPLLLLFTSWAAIALSTLLTGQPFRPYGD